MFWVANTVNAFALGCLSSFPQDCWAAHTDLFTHICSRLKEAMGSWLPQRASRLSLLKQEWRLLKWPLCPPLATSQRIDPEKSNFLKSLVMERGTKEGLPEFLRAREIAEWLCACLACPTPWVQSSVPQKQQPRKKTLEKIQKTESWH